MYSGKKGVAQKIVYDAFDIIKEKTGKIPLEIKEQIDEEENPKTEPTEEEMLKKMIQKKKEQGGFLYF